jgi:hypothetical protein
METPKFKDAHVIISGVPYPVKFGFLSFSIFNDLGYTMQDCVKAGVLLRLYHSAILAGCQRNGVPEISWDDFNNSLDDDDNCEVFNELKALYESDNAPKK